MNCRVNHLESQLDHTLNVLIKSNYLKKDSFIKHINYLNMKKKKIFDTF